MSVCISTCLKKKLKELRLSRYDDDYDGYQFKEAVTVRK
jgi:hypothetical protein